jgi:hypothetical protein
VKKLHKRKNERTRQPNEKPKGGLIARGKEARKGGGRREKAPIEGKATIKIDQETPPQKPKEDKGLRMIDWKIIGN